MGQRVKERTLCKHNIEAQLVELMPSCNYVGTILLSLLGMCMVYVKTQLVFPLTTSASSALEGKSTRMPSPWLWMTSTKGYGPSVCPSVSDACTQEAYPHSQTKEAGSGNETM